MPGTININRDFIEAGHAIFTVSNPAGEHYTYRVTKPKDFSELSPMFFVGVLSGPDNTRDYSYLGLLRGNGQLILTKGSKFTVEAKAWKVALWVFKLVLEGKEVPEGYAIQHEGKCGKCGRALTDPKSIETGLGPICAGRN